MSWFRNHAELTSHGLSRQRAAALEVAAAGLEALDPAAAITRHVASEDGVLVVDGRPHPVEGRVVVLGAGKASYRIAWRLEQILGERLDGGLVAVRRGEGGPLRRVEVIDADHPVPSEDSRAAGRAMLNLAAGLGPDDLAVCCITGGSSALLSVPPDGVPFTAKQDLHRLLLGSGAAIDKMNAVRKHVSQIKGGRLAERIAPASILNLTVSDVLGDQLDLITCPTVADTTTAADAIEVLHEFGLWDRVHPSIRAHLRTEEAESPDVSGNRIETTLVLATDGACEAMAESAARLGYRPILLSNDFDGEAVGHGRAVAMAARGCFAEGRLGSPPCILIGCGGESSVTLDSLQLVIGKGGPNQEVALAAAMSLDENHPVAVLSMDTDGSDGGSLAAGGIADSLTRRRALALGEDPDRHLQAHTSGVLLGRLGDLLDTGATGTNVNDLFVAVIGEAP